MRRTGCIAALMALAVGVPAASSPATSSDPYCTGSYGGGAPRARALRMGIDPGLAGSAGSTQLPSAPNNRARDLAAVNALAVPGHRLVVRLNRLFWSAGRAGIKEFKSLVGMYTGAGFDVELQVRYHPPSGKDGDIRAWVRYVRHVVDSFGARRRVVDMTITNEVNLNTSSNTSDGSFTRAKDALIRGIEAAHAEALRRGYRQLRFGFTYAYRWNPQSDAAFFSYLRSHGGKAFRRALGFVGLDFYPGSFFPPYPPGPGDSYRAELAQAAGVLRDCYLPKAEIGRSIPIWITENGVPSDGTATEPQQESALEQLVRATHDYAHTYNITDYRWFNLRDSTDNPPESLAPQTFSTDGLLLADYARKPSFGAYHRLIGRYGAR